MIYFSFKNWKQEHRILHNRLIQERLKYNQELARLKEQLDEAQKNDARDPKTGRYIKRGSKK